MTSARRENSLISIVIPVFNEETGVQQLRDRLSGLRSLWENEELEFVFVDDGSTDNTYAALQSAFAADPLSCIVRHQRNMGVGAALRSGFASCRGSLVCTIDADCSYGPENLHRLVDALRKQSADVAVASPYHPEGSVEGVPGWRLVLSKSCSVLYRMIAPVRLYTYTSLFRAYRKEAVESVRFQENGFVCAAEFLIRAAEEGFSIVEVPMILHTRKYGQTKMKVASTIHGHLRLMGATLFRRFPGTFRRDNRSTQIRRNEGPYLNT
jgi:dolichol-phosphate mannosyltransferase